MPETRQQAGLGRRWRATALKGAAVANRHGPWIEQGQPHCGLLLRVSWAEGGKLPPLLAARNSPASWLGQAVASHRTQGSGGCQPPWPMGRARAVAWLLTHGELQRRPKVRAPYLSRRVSALAQRCACCHYRCQASQPSAQPAHRKHQTSLFNTANGKSNGCAFLLIPAHVLSTRPRPVAARGGGR